MLTVALDFFGICFNLGAADSQDRWIVEVTRIEDGLLAGDGTGRLGRHCAFRETFPNS
jgi:hypothetical protein